MTIDLSDEERNLLIGLLQREIGDLGPEIRHTQTSTYREDLKSAKATLRHLCDRLRAAAQA